VGGVGSDISTFWDSLLRHRLWAGGVIVASAILTAALTQIGQRLGDRLAAIRLATPGELRRYRRSIQAEYATHHFGFESAAVNIADVYQPAEYQSADRRDLATAALSRHRHVVLLGPAGAGKTLFLKQQLLDWSRRDRRARRREGVPVFVQLHRLGGSVGSAEVRRLVVDELRQSGVSRAKSLLSRAARRGRMAFLFDGLDEVPIEFRDPVVHSLRDFARGFRKCRIVVTCRDTGYQTDLSDGGRQFARISLLDLDDAAMFVVLRRLYRDDDGRAAQLLEAIRARPELLRMARNPLMLTIMAFVSLDARPGLPLEQFLPASRADLYQAAMSHLISRDEARGVPVNAAAPSAAAHLAALRAMALALLDGTLGVDRISVDYSQLLGFLGGWLQSAGSSVSAETMVAAVTGRSQLLVGHRGRYRFRHQTFCDALAAQELTSRADELLRRFRRAPGDWQETVLLWCGISGQQASSLVKALARSRTKEHRVIALQCLTETGDVESSVARAVIADFEPALAAADCDSRITVALGLIAGRKQYDGDSLFERLARTAVAGSGSHRSAAQAALAASNTSRAAGILADLLDADPAARDYLKALGQVALESLRDRAGSGSVAAVDGVASIRTPDALRTLIELAGHPGPGSERAVWRVAQACVDEVNVELLHTLRQESLGWSSAQRDAAAEYGWVWEPFPTTGDTSLPTVMGRIAQVLDAGTEPIPEDLDEIPWRIALPIVVIGLHDSIKLARRARGGLLRRLLSRLMRPDTESLNRDLAAALAGASLQVRSEKKQAVARLNLQGDPRYLDLLTLLPDRLFAEAVRIVYGRSKFASPTQESWRLVRRETRASARLGVGALFVALASMVAIVYASGYRLIYSFFTASNGPVWPSWAFVGSIALISLAFSLAENHEGAVGVVAGRVASLGCLAAFGILLTDAWLVIADRLGAILAFAVVVVVPSVAAWLALDSVGRGFARRQENRNPFRPLIALAEGRG